MSKPSDSNKQGVKMLARFFKTRYCWNVALLLMVFFIAISYSQDDGSQIDIMVVYTAGALDRRLPSNISKQSKIDQFNSTIINQIQRTENAMYDSKALLNGVTQIKIKLCYIGEVTFGCESQNITDNDKIENLVHSDYGKDIRLLRDQSSADIVCVIINFLNIDGIAYNSTSPTNADENGFILL